MYTSKRTQWQQRPIVHWFIWIDEHLDNENTGCCIMDQNKSRARRLHHATRRLTGLYLVNVTGLLCTA